MKPSSNPPRVKAAWQRAGAALAANGHRLLMVEAWLVTILLVSAYVLLCSSYSAFSELPNLTQAASVLLAVGFVLLLVALTVLVTFPWLMGISSLASQISLGETPTLASLFLPFSSARAHRCAIALFCMGLWSFFATYLGVQLAAVGQTEKRSAKARMCRCVRFAGLRFWLFCLPRILLGILTFGIYLLWDVFPRIPVAYCFYCQLLSEDIKDHE